MTNLEKFKDEIKKVYLKKGYLGDAVFCVAECNGYKYKRDVDNDQYLIDWLLEEYEEPIKLKQWEKDLLKSFGDTASHHKFDYFPSLREMKHMGYFDGVKDTSMELGDILGNCEVVE